MPVRTALTQGSVLVLFRTSEKGEVVDVSARGGSPEAQQASIGAVQKWRFGDSFSGGQPFEIHSAVIFNFSHDPVTTEVPSVVLVQQLSPLLDFRCYNSVLRQAPHAVDFCAQQAAAVEQDPSSTAMDRFSAYEEYGLALLNGAHKPKNALDEFSLAVQVASQEFKPSDPEYAYAYWHRAEAEQELGNNAEAEADLAAADAAMKRAQKASADPRMGEYCHKLLQQMVDQHVALLKADGKFDEAGRVLREFRE